MPQVTGYHLVYLVDVNSLAYPAVFGYIGYMQVVDCFVHGGQQLTVVITFTTRAIFLASMAFLACLMLSFSSASSVFEACRACCIYICM